MQCNGGALLQHVVFGQTQRLIPVAELQSDRPKSSKYALAKRMYSITRRDDSEVYGSSGKCGVAKDSSSRRSAQGQAGQRVVNCYVYGYV